jgi:hypothetical protein
MRNIPIMKHRITFASCLAFTAFGITAAPPAAPAMAEEPCLFVGHVAGLDPHGDNNLSVRKGPGRAPCKAAFRGCVTKDNEKDELFTNDSVCARQHEGRWLFVSYHRNDRLYSGWVYDKYIAMDPPGGTEGGSSPSPAHAAGADIVTGAGENGASFISLNGTIALDDGERFATVAAGLESRVRLGTRIVVIMTSPGGNLESSNKDRRIHLRSSLRNVGPRPVLLGLCPGLGGREDKVDQAIIRRRLPQRLYKGLT